MNTYKTEGVVLKRINFGEADRILTIYTKHHGKVVLLAKGIRKMSSRKRGNLEIFNQVIFFAVKGKGMDVITEVETKNSFSSWRKDLKKVIAAYEICEMTDKLSPENSEQEEIYESLVSYLEKLKEVSRNNLEIWVDSFGKFLLQTLGYWPKERPYPSGFNVSFQIEQIIEKELKSKKFLKRV